jgi:RNase P subunit RPR2
VDDPHIEHRTVDYVRRGTCPACGQILELPREEPWIVDGETQHAPMLVAIRCKFCDAEIRLTDE